MTVRLQRHDDNGKDTYGALYFKLDGQINWTFMCFVLEDQHRDVKVAGDTRIPAGDYVIKLRLVGTLHDKYLKKFGPQFHKGMLEITGIPNFSAVMFHIGNSERDTAGCPLLGDGLVYTANGSRELTASTQAYTRVYPLIQKACTADGSVKLEVRNELD